MRYFIFLLLFSLPSAAGASVAVPNSLEETQAIPQGFSPKKQRFFERFAKNVLQKRIKKALGRSNGEAAKGLSIFGFVCSVMGIIFLFAGAAAGLVLLSAGLILSIIGLALSSSATKKWVKGMAIAGIVLPVVVGLLILAWLGSGY